MKIARKAELLGMAQKKFEAEESDKAGDLGEELAHQCLQKILRQLGGKAKILPSLRVPKLTGQGKYEIDLVLVSEGGILVVEVKHWSGSLAKENAGWTQTRGQSKKILQDPVKLNQEKSATLRQWLAQRGLAVPNTAMHSVVVLTHPQAALCPKLKRDTSILTLATLPDIARALCALPKSRFWQKRAERPFDFRAVAEALAALPTWDQIQLHGGKKYFGDMESIVLRNVPLEATRRANILSAKVVMVRKVFPGILFKPKLRVKDWAGKKKTYPLDLEAKVIFRLAGQGVIEEIPWVHVETLQLGWKDQSFYNAGTDVSRLKKSR
jgi:hypothetical protein